MTTTISFNINDLTDNGRHLLAAVTAQSRHLALILAPRDGRIDADIDDEGDSDDVIRVRATDRLTWGERARRYGVEALDPAYVARDETGRPIRRPEGYLPTEDYIREIEAFYGDALADRNSRLWKVPRDIVRRAARGELTGVAAWNAIADAFVAWCDEGQFKVLISEDWITQTEAAVEFGVSHNAVRQAVAAGRLPTWEDWREPNPQRRTRVSHAAAARIWATPETA